MPAPQRSDARDVALDARGHVPEARPHPVDLGIEIDPAVVELEQLHRDRGLAAVEERVTGDVEELVERVRRTGGDRVAVLVHGGSRQAPEDVVVVAGDEAGELQVHASQLSRDPQLAAVGRLLVEARGAQLVRARGLVGAPCEQLDVGGRALGDGAGQADQCSKGVATSPSEPLTGRKSRETRRPPRGVPRTSVASMRSPVWASSQSARNASSNR